MSNESEAPEPCQGVKQALLNLAGGAATVIRHTSRRWLSTTFQGTRESLVLRFTGKDWDIAFRRFVEELDDHEFAIKGKLVADACVVNSSAIHPHGITFEVELMVLSDDI